MERCVSIFICHVHIIAWKRKKISKKKKYNYEHAMGQINKLIKNNY